MTTAKSLPPPSVTYYSRFPLGKTGASFAKPIGEGLISAREPGAVAGAPTGLPLHELREERRLEQRADKVAWWFKNGSEGADSFGLKYWNTAENRSRLFYPDWIVRFKDGRIGIFDTKGGTTAKSAEGREVGLRDRIAAMNAAAGCARFFGGLVVREGGLWLCHDGTTTPMSPARSTRTGGSLAI